MVLIIFSCFVIYALLYWVPAGAEDEDLGPGGKRIRPGISANIIAELTDCNAMLSGQRKKRQVPLMQFWEINTNTHPQDTKKFSNCNTAQL